MSDKKAEQQGTTAVSTPVVSTPAVSTSWYQRHQTGAWLITTGLAVVAIVVTILIGLFGGVMPHLERESDLQIKNQVGDGLKEPLKKIGAMAEDIAEIKGELKILGPSLNKQLSEKMRDIARMNAKELASSLPRLSETVAAARKAKIAIEPRLVGEAGERVLEVAATQTEQASAWDSVNEFLGYRSFLNSSLVPDTSNFTNIFSHPIDWQFDLEPHFYQYLWFSWEARSGKPVPADKAAVMERLDHHLNTDKKVGPAFLLMMFMARHHRPWTASGSRM